MNATAPRLPLLATRARKARRHGSCALCPAPVIIGQRIGLLAGRQWAHVSCIIAARQAETAQEQATSGRRS